ncbi:MAG: quercetin 2,3-dioxygenase [Hyphomicrobiales bacterium]|nr:quercetin 2,3-dioxygenase [Hyphomicrobiales bacterium]
MAGAAEAYICRPGESEIRWMGDTSTHFLATGKETNDAFCLVDERAKRGEAVPLHRHAKDMESFYVLEGEISLFIDNQPGARAAAGSFAHIPGGTVHGFRVESDTARYLIMTTAHHGEFYRAITLPSLVGGLPPGQGVSDDTINEACGKYGIEFIGALPEQ